MKKLSMTLTLMASILVGVRGHGRLMDPPARSTMWRKGFQNVPKDYSDHGLFCGGARNQRQNGGKCGVCGAPYQGPYDHELGGKFYTDAIAETYKSGQVFTAQVELTAAHRGWFEFKVCPITDRTREATQGCLNHNVLSLADGSGTRYKVTISGRYMHKVALRLPAGLACDFCVLQWRYHTGNSFGTDPDGTSCVGCGPQEEFYGCANVVINPAGGAGGSPTPAPVVVNPTPAPVVVVNPTPAPCTPMLCPSVPCTPAPTGGNNPAPATPAPAASNECRGADGPFKNQPGIDDYCKNNCKLGNCPTTHCTCGPAKRDLSELTNGITKAEAYQMLRELLKKISDGDEL